MNKPEAETHPSFGLARFSKVTSSPGASLFDSEIRHQHYITFTVSTAKRERQLNRDWLYGQEEIIEIAMSHAQFGALVSSFNDGSGVPVTITRRGQDLVPSPPYAPRMQHSVREVEQATDKLVAELAEAVEALRESFDNKAGRKETADKLRDIEIKLGNAKSNARYTANTFTEHVENVITKARYDIEAAALGAAEKGLNVGPSVAGLLGSADDV